MSGPAAIPRRAASAQINAARLSIEVPPSSSVADRTTEAPPREGENPALGASALKLDELRSVLEGILISGGT